MHAPKRAGRLTSNTTTLKFAVFSWKIAITCGWFSDSRKLNFFGFPWSFCNDISGVSRIFTVTMARTNAQFRQAISHESVNLRQESMAFRICCPRWCATTAPEQGQIQHWIAHSVGATLWRNSPAVCPAFLGGWLGCVGMACSHCEFEVKIHSSCQIILCQLDAIPALALTLGSLADDDAFRSRQGKTLTYIIHWFLRTSVPDVFSSTTCIHDWYVFHLFCCIGWVIYWIITSD